LLGNGANIVLEFKDATYENLWEFGYKLNNFRE